MGRQKLTIVLLLALPLGLASLACGDSRERQALADDELERELHLAFQGDTVAPAFEDAPVDAESETPQAQPTQPRAPQTQAPRPQPRPTQPAPTQPAQPTQPQPRTVTMAVPTGTTLAIRMNDELSTARTEAGDGFTATLTAPIIDAAGIVLVPAGATVRGRVTAVAPSTRVGQTATMNLAFETISFGGQTYPLHASVERADVRQQTRTTAAEQAGKVAAGAAAGAILGQVIGRDRSSTIRGAVVGAAAGTAIAMGTADVDAVLPAGAEVVIRLDQPIQVTRTVAG